MTFALIILIIIKINTESVEQSRSELKNLSNSYRRWEDQSQMDNFQDCNSRGTILADSPFSNIQDMVISGYDNASLTYTSKPVPSQLTVQQSQLPGATLGVFAVTGISTSIRMGPYVGKKVLMEEAGRFYNTAYAWEVRKGEGSFYIDGQDLNLSNWMRYVNCARDKQEQNLAAYQEEDKIYYRVIKEIPAGTELLVLYDEDYALDLFTGSSGAEFVRMAQKIGTILEHFKGSRTCSGVNGENTMTENTANEESVDNFGEDEIAGRNVVGCCTTSMERLGGIERDSGTTAATDDEIDSESYDSDDLLECSECRRQFQGEDEFLKHGCCQHLVPSGGILARETERSGVGDSDCPRGKGAPLEGGSGRGFSFPLSDTSEGSPLSESCGSGISQSNHNHKCPFCWELLPSLESFLDHCKKSHDGWKPVICRYCRQSFASETHLESHVCCSDGGGGGAGSEERGTDSSKYTRPRSTNGNRGRCEYCGKDVSNLREHVRIHTGAKPYKCGVCGKDFRFNSSLSQHIKTHTNEKAYKCEVCGKAFTHSSNLSQHRKTHSKASDKPHKCDHCGKGFHLKSHLSQHLRMHSDAKPFECEHCHKKFSSKSYLTFHVKSHLGEKAFKCSECPKTFTQRVYLKQHMKTHSEEKDYKCEYCGKMFRHQSNLSQHYKVHTADKPFLCEVCGKSFGRQKNLRQHQATHV